MSLSIYKIKELEVFASKLNTEPDRLVDALISFVFEKPEPIRLATPEEKVKVIEKEALDKGWTYEQLWKRPELNVYPEMGLICFIDDKIMIGDVKEKHISLIHERPVGVPAILNFYNNKVKQHWIKKEEQKQDGTPLVKQAKGGQIESK